MDHVTPHARRMPIGPAPFNVTRKSEVRIIRPPHRRNLRRRIVIISLFVNSYLAGVTYLARIGDYQAAALLGILGSCQLAGILMYWLHKSHLSKARAVQAHRLPSSGAHWTSEEDQIYSRVEQGILPSSFLFSH